jgi:twitching motility protein PilT
LIADADFVDLYLGHDFADVKGLAGQPRKMPVPAEWASEILELKAQCLRQFETTREPEFALVLEERVLLRVTYILDVFAKPFFVLNRSRATILALDDLGLPDHIHDCLLNEHTRGLVYVVGEMGAGKTSTAASAVKARLTSLGGGSDLRLRTRQKRSCRGSTGRDAAFSYQSPGPREVTQKR